MMKEWRVCGKVMLLGPYLISMCDDVFLFQCTLPPFFSPPSLIDSSIDHQESKPTTMTLMMMTITKEREDKKNKPSSLQSLG